MTDHASSKTSPLHHPRVRSLGTWLAIIGILAVAAVALGAVVIAVQSTMQSTAPKIVPTQPPAPATDDAVLDDMGRSVVIPSTPKRIVALVPFAADMLLDLGVTPVAVPAIRGGGPSTWDGLPTVAVDHSAGPSIEQVVAANPDLVIATSAYAQFLPTLEASVKAPVLVLDINRLDDVARHLRTLGRVTGTLAKAEEIAASVEHAAASQATAMRGKDPTRVLAIFGTPHAFFGFLPDSYMGDLVQRSSGELVTKGLNSHKVFKGLTPLSMEAIVAKEPEVVLVVFHGAPETARAMLARDPAWGKLAAVKNDRVHILTEDHFIMHPGRSPVAALAMIAKAIGTGGN
jgi:iron complex transport system substrate-binding protein